MLNNYMRPSVDRKVAFTYRTVRTGDGVVGRIVAWQKVAVADGRYMYLRS